MGFVVTTSAFGPPLLLTGLGQTTHLLFTYIMFIVVLCRPRDFHGSLVDIVGGPQKKFSNLRPPIQTSQ